MTTLISSLKDVLSDTWPMIALSCVVLIAIRLAYLIKNKQQIIVSRELMTISFVIYILCLFQVVTSQDVSSVHGVNITLFKELTRYQIGTKLFYRNIVGNILLFVPFGFFTSCYLKLNRKSFIFFLTLIVSLVIEAIQLKIGRAFDVDDIILNMVGSITGYYAYRFVDSLFGDLSDTFKGTLMIVGILTAIVLITIIFI